MSISKFLMILSLIISFHNLQAQDGSDLNVELQLGQQLLYCEKITYVEDADIGEVEIGEKLWIKTSPESSKRYAFYHRYGYGSFYLRIEIDEVQKELSLDKNTIRFHLSGKILDKVSSPDKSAQIFLLLKNSQKPVKHGIGKLTTSFTSSEKLNCKSIL